MMMNKNDDTAYLSKVAIRFCNEYIGLCNLERKIRKLGEEVAEFCQAVGTNNKDRMREELGDILFIVNHMTDALDTTLYDLLSETLDKLENRITNPNYKRHDKNGS
jgi:NTP pyrophosphatase (non-canonical NTP hydrolase)